MEGKNLGRRRGGYPPVRAGTSPGGLSGGHLGGHLGTRLGGGVGNLDDAL